MSPIGVLFLILAACGDDGAAPVVEPVHREAAPPPEGLMMELRAGGGSAALGELREGTASPLVRAVLPATPGELFERFAPVPPAVVERVPEDAQVVGVLVRIGDEPRLATATRVRVDAGDRPLGAAVPLEAGAPHGARFVGGRPGRDELAVVLIDDVLVAARNAAVLERALPYLAFTMLPGDAEPGISMRILDGVVAGPIRRLVDAALGAQLDRWREAARTERARHEGPPELGDPEAVIALIEETLRPLVAYLPDVGEVRGRLRAERGAVSITFDADVREGTPLARELASARAGRPVDLLALPAEVGLAWSAANGEPGEGPGALLGRIGGERLADRDRARVDAAWQGFTSARGGRTVVALGASAGGPWAIAATAGTAPADPDPRAPFDPELLRSAIGQGYVGDVIGAMLGCPGRAALAPWTRDAGAAPAIDRRTAELCAERRPEPPHPRVAISSGAGVLALAVTQSDAAAPPVDRDVAGRLGGGERRGLAADPDAARAIEALGDDTLVAGALGPSRLIESAAVLDLAAFRRAAAARSEGPSRRGAIVLALSRRSGGLQLRAVLPPSALDDLAEIMPGLVRPD